MKRAICILAVFILVTSQFHVFAADNKYDGYELAWADEFDGSKLNENMWNYEIGYVRNNELQYYTKDNVSVHDSMLDIEGQREEHNGFEYTSGSINTRNKYSFKYGIVEVRAKLPKGDGIWPAIWSCGYPSDTAMCEKYDNYKFYNYEIDIAELYGGKNYDNTVYGVLHWADQNNEFHKSSDVFTLKNGLFNDDFHIFTLMWTPEYITWAVDDTEYYRVSTDKVSMEGLYDLEQDLRINLAISNLWSGNASDNSFFPCSLLVDYVRYYKPTNDNLGVSYKNADYDVGLRSFAESQGYTVGWDAEYSAATICDGKNKLSFCSGTKEICLNGKEILTMEEPSANINGTFTVSHKYLVAAIEMLEKSE